MSWETKPLLLKNGLPIPQQFDPALDEWVEYTNEDIKALRGELALVKTELQTIKANQLSGDQKVTLSGTIRTEALGTGIAISAGSTVYTDERVNAEKMVGLCFRVSGQVSNIVATPQFRIPVPGVTPWAVGTVVSGDAPELVVNQGSATTTVKMTRVYGTHRRWAFKNNHVGDLLLLSIYEVREV